MQLLPRPGQMRTTGHVQGAPTQKGAFSAGENSVCAGGPHGHKAEHPKASGPGTSPFEGTSVTHTVGLCWPCRAWVLLLAAHLATPGQPAKGAVAAKTMLGPSSVTGAKGTTKLTRLGMDKVFGSKPRGFQLPCCPEPFDTCKSKGEGAAALAAQGMPCSSHIIFPMIPWPLSCDCLHRSSTKTSRSSERKLLL